MGVLPSQSELFPIEIDPVDSELALAKHNLFRECKWREIQHREANDQSREGRLGVHRIGNKYAAAPHVGP